MMEIAILPARLIGACGLMTFEEDGDADPQYYGTIKMILCSRVLSY